MTKKLQLETLASKSLRFFDFSYHFPLYLSEIKNSYISKNYENRKFNISGSMILDEDNIDQLETMREFYIKQHLDSIEKHYQAMSDEEGCGAIFADIRLMNTHYVT